MTESFHSQPVGIKYDRRLINRRMVTVAARLVRQERESEDGPVGVRMKGCSSPCSESCSGPIPRGGPIGHTGAVSRVTVGASPNVVEHSMRPPCRGGERMSPARMARGETACSREPFSCARHGRELPSAWEREIDLEPQLGGRGPHSCHSLPSTNTRPLVRTIDWA